MTKGICGPHAVSMGASRYAIYKSVFDIINAWDGGYKGFATVKDMKRELAKYGWDDIKTVRGNKLKELKLPEGYGFAIARIQWGDGEWKHWAEAQQNTHYVYLEGNEFISDEIPWRNLSKSVEYLEAGNGVVTSYLVNGNKSENISDEFQA